MSSEIETVGNVPTFVKKKHELSKLQKMIEKGSERAVNLLIETIENEKTDLKIKIDCAKIIIDAQIKISAEVSKDSLTRQIADLKYKQMGTLHFPKGDSEEDQKPKPPKLDFMTVQVIK